LFQACASAMRSQDRPRKIVWRFVASRPAHPQSSRPLPRRADGGFETYLRRAAAETRSRDVTFIVNDAQAASAPLFDDGVDFLAGLCGLLGTPMETDCV